MAHPLNRPRFDVAAARVVEGYGVLQPRVTPSLPVGREGSLFQRIFSSMSGIDPYAAAVSDVYQDLFGEGSYAGKGIYEIEDVRGRSRRPRAGFDTAEVMISSRVCSPAPVSSPISRLSRNSRPVTTLTLCVTIAGRAAIGSSCRGYWDADPGRPRRRDATPSHRSAAGRCSTICGGRYRRQRQS